jgi:adenylate kinase
MNPKTYVFFGNVGAGKGTQIDLLKKFCLDNNQHVVFFSPGAEFRALVATGSYTAQSVKKILDAGHLLPDALTTGMFTTLLRNELTAESTIFTDGYPRSIVQSNEFIQMMEFYGRDNIEMIYIDVSKEEAIKRMKLRGRADDTDEGISNRFAVYEGSVLPALEVLKQKGYKLYKVNGLQSVEEVHQEVKNVLGL